MLAHFLATLQLRRFFTELRAHRRIARASYWAIFKRDIVWLLLPPKLTALWTRLQHGSTPPWSDQPIAPEFAERLIKKGDIDAAKLRIAAKPEIDMRGQMQMALRRIMARATPGRWVQAARHGLELTRPFHDKRVVELALAVPQELYVKNGRNRYLACAALKNVYPRRIPDALAQE